jgi:hypothetical protein
MNSNGTQRWYQNEISMITMQTYLLTRELARNDPKIAKVVTGLSEDQLELIADLSCDDICALSACTHTLNCKFDTVLVEGLLQGNIDFRSMKVLAYAKPINALVANFQFSSFL